MSWHVLAAQLMLAMESLASCRPAGASTASASRHPAATWLQVFSSWIHITAVRLFVESILRYGLPPQFLAALMRPNPKTIPKLRKVGRACGVCWCLGRGGVGVMLWRWGYGWRK